MSFKPRFSAARTGQQPIWSAASRNTDWMNSLVTLAFSAMGADTALKSSSVFASRLAARTQSSKTTREPTAATTIRCHKNGTVEKLVSSAAMNSTERAHHRFWRTVRCSVLAMMHSNRSAQTSMPEYAMPRKLSCAG